MAENILSRKIKYTFTLRLPRVTGNKIITAFKKTAEQVPTSDSVTIVDGARCEWLWMALQQLGRETAAYLTPRSDYQEAPFSPNGIYKTIYLVVTSTEGYILADVEQLILEQIKSRLEKAIQE